MADKSFPAEQPQLARIPVGVSSCLLGERVRYDGGHKNHSYIADTLGEYFDLQPFCPEVAIGMGVPRETIRLVDTGEGIRVQGTKDSSLDVTEKLRDIADNKLRWHESLCGYIVKKDSPSCGMERVKVFKNAMPEKRGAGLYTQTMMKNCACLPVEEEGRLGDAALRENFIQRVYVMDRWKKMLVGGVQWSELTDFHARHKFIYYSHNQNAARALGKALADASKAGLTADHFAPVYLQQMMQLLRVVATRANHVNTLEHIRGYLKTPLDKDDKAELTETIEQYRQGFLPLIVPVTLLRHHFRRNPHSYIAQSWYLQPHPGELMLLNSL